MLDATRFVACLALAFALPDHAADPGPSDEPWIAWGGPSGDFVVDDAPPLVEDWGETGPRVLWKHELGAGYSSILHRDGRLYTAFRDEDLEIEGNVDGNVNLTNHQLTVGANGRLKAQVVAKSIIVIGQVIGDLTATERIEIQATGVVEGDLKAPRLNVQEGAVLNGSIDMSAPGAADVKKPAQPAQPQQ